MKRPHPKKKEYKKVTHSMKRFIKDKQRLLLPIAVMIFALIGAWVLNFSKAETPVSNASCGAKVTPYNYQVPFGNAVWNQPVCNLPRYSKSAEYVSRFYNWSNLTLDPSTATNKGRISVSPGYPKEPTFDDLTGLGKLFTREIYYTNSPVNPATTTTKIATADVSPSNLDGEDNKSMLPDTPIPWNPKWKASQGGDNEIYIIDDRPEGNGRTYKINGYNNGVFCWATGRICTGSTNVARDLNGDYVDYRTYEGFVDERGVGLSFLATLTLPQEVEAGEIRHTLGMAIPNTSFGPVCTAEQKGTSAEGVSCGVAFAPATKHEHGGKSKLQHVASQYQFYTLDKTIPEGMVFALDMTDAQIESWLNSRTDLAGVKRNTARIFAVALRDYGVMVVDTNGNWPGIQVAGGINPENAAKWTALGLGPNDGKNLLEGLITENNLHVVEPPTVTCINGTTSKYSCKWVSAQYSSSGTNPQPTDTTKPIVSITSPANNSVFSQGVVTVNATASDNVAVSKVEFYVDNQNTPIVTDTSAPYSSGDSINLSAGAHTIKAIAQDSSGNRSNPATISITVSQPQVAKSCDFDSNDIVEIADLARVLSNWKKDVETNTNGDCSGPAGSPDGYVSLEDLAKVLTVWKK